MDFRLPDVSVARAAEGLRRFYFWQELVLDHG
jgi:hypothetical protein